MKTKLWLLIFALLTIGCETSDNSFVATSPGQFVTAPVVGKVFASADVAGQTVELRDSSGGILDSVVTNESGNFVFRGTVPADFRLVVPLENGLFLAREVRGFTGDGFFVVNVPTTLVSLNSGGGLSLADAEALVQAQLQLSSREALFVIEDGVGTEFSHFAFFVEAANNGGVQAYLMNLADSQGALGTPYLLTRDDIGASVSSLSPQIQTLLDQVRSDPRINLALRRPVSRRLDRVFKSGGQSPPNPATENPDVLLQGLGLSAASNILEYIGTSAESSLVADDTNADKVFSWVGVALGWRTSSTATLENIEAQLNQVQAGITELDQKSDNQNFQDAKDDLATNSINPLTEIISSELLAISTTTSSDLDNMPAGSSDLPQNTQNYLALLTADSAFSDAQANLREVQAAMVGFNAVPVDPGPVAVPQTQGQNLIMEGAKIALTDELGITVGVGNGSEVQQWANFPVRSGFLLDQALQTFELYAEYQMLGMVALGETGHSTSNPSADIDNLITQTDNAMASIISQRSQVPHYPRSENFFIDLQNGLIWYTVAQGNMDLADAKTFAANFQDGVYNDGQWRLPAFQETVALQQRGVYATVADGSLDYGDTLTGLQNLGFDLTGVNSDGEVWNTEWFYSAPDWVISATGGQIFRLTHESDNHRNFDTTDDNPSYPVLLVHSIGKPVIAMNDPNANNEPDGVWPDSMTSSVSGHDLPFVGVLTGFSDLEFFIDELSFTGAWNSTFGGSFRIGTDTINTQINTDRISGYYGTTDHTLPYMYYTTSNVADLRASNFPHSFGDLFFNTFNSSTLFLNSAGSSGTVFPVPVQASIGTTAEFVDSDPFSNQISPRNLTLDLVGVSPSSDMPTQRFVLTSFYKDESKIVRDSTSSVTWVAEDADTGQPVPGVTFAESVPGELVFDVSQFPTNVDQLNLKISTDGFELEDETLVLVDIR